MPPGKASEIESTDLRILVSWGHRNLHSYRRPLTITSNVIYSPHCPVAQMRVHERGRLQAPGPIPRVEVGTDAGTDSAERMRNWSRLLLKLIL